MMIMILFNIFLFILFFILTETFLNYLLSYILSWFFGMLDNYFDFKVFGFVSCLSWPFSAVEVAGVTTVAVLAVLAGVARAGLAGVAGFSDVVDDGGFSVAAGAASQPGSSTAKWFHVTIACSSTP